MAVAVLGGLTLSTRLSSLVVPAFYVVTDRIKAKITRKSSLPTATLPEPTHAA